VRVLDYVLDVELELVHVLDSVLDVELVLVFAPVERPG
jgi:hypothetical protein